MGRDNHIISSKKCRSSTQKAWFADKGTHWAVPFALFLPFFPFFFFAVSVFSIKSYLPMSSACLFYSTPVAKLNLAE